ncbi:hypothetical protein PPTG_24884 [Phytophthora nicotianae INRA-310]|uniref:Uncharacterized protein n=1 Tax=Phytophthora nicotianae (strain INRA-310) TaxID=761204 RepID=W2P9X1_PHYN3|nr:hypothetical protein PPTG_24884 [Phytophthora nicotianae INRA-310]ETM97631.1 hypothetical protein PPTG_24884 [Phytophthora nicotianae INRA-310]
MRVVDTRGTREETELGDGESQEVVVQDGDLDIAGSIESQEMGVWRPTP